MKEIIKNKVSELFEELVAIRRYFHQHPELKFEEYETSKKIQQLLTEWGIENQVIAKTGVVGIIRGERPGKTIAIRADIDGLPIQEDTQLSFSSKNEGRMHACGHDGHITIALGAAKILSEFQEKLCGNVKFIFQPAEEMPGGAVHMINEGALKNPDVDGIIGLHIWPDLKKGLVGISKGPIMSAVDGFDIEVIGTGGHGALPNKAIDPIPPACQILNSLQNIICREIDPFDCVVLSSCSFNAGSAFNIIPEKVKISGTVRYFNKDFSEYIPKRIGELVDGISKGYRCQSNLKYNHFCPVVINNKEFTDFFEEIACDVVGNENVLVIKRPSMGGEDFSYYLENVSGTFFFLGTRDEENGFDKSIHDPQYNFSEDILNDGVELFVNTAIHYLNG